MTATMRTKNDVCVDYVELKCTPVEFLVINKALILISENEEVHNDDREVAKSMTGVQLICKEVN